MDLYIYIFQFFWKYFILKDNIHGYLYLLWKDNFYLYVLLLEFYLEYYAEYFTPLKI